MSDLDIVGYDHNGEPMVLAQAASEILADLDQENQQLKQRITELESKLLDEMAENQAQHERIEQLEKFNLGLANESHEKSERIEQLERGLRGLSSAVIQWDDCDTASQVRRAQDRMVWLAKQTDEQLRKGGEL